MLIRPSIFDLYCYLWIAYLAIIPNHLSMVSTSFSLWSFAQQILTCLVFHCFFTFTGFMTVNTLVQLLHRLTVELQPIISKAKGVARGGKGPCPPKISSISCYFVLWEAVSQTKYCCLLKVKRFGPPKFWAVYVTVWCLGRLQSCQTYVFLGIRDFAKLA